MGILVQNPLPCTPQVSKLKYQVLKNISRATDNPEAYELVPADRVAVKAIGGTA